MIKLYNPDLGLLLIRVALGGVFATHGLGKLLNLGPTAAFFMSLELPAAFAYIIGALEVLAGFAMLTGIFVRIAGLAIAGVMIGAIAYVKWSEGFLGGWEFEATLLLAAVAMTLAGAGKYTLLRQSGRQPAGQRISPF